MFEVLIITRQSRNGVRSLNKATENNLDLKSDKDGPGSCRLFISRRSEPGVRP